MFKLVHKNKKGFSLVELLVTIVILAMVMSLGGQILYQLTNFYSMAAHRWEIQNAVQLAGRKFETERDSITNSYEADILYDPIVAEGIVMADDGTFTWKDGSTKSYVMLTEGTTDSDNPYTYIFSTPTYDTDGNYLGTWLFVRQYGAANSEPFLENEGFGDVPVEVEFSIATSVPALTTEDESSEAVQPTYLNNTISIKFKSGLENITNYEVNTSYTLVNTPESSGKKINYNGRYLTFETDWLGGESGRTAMASPAGWTDETLNSQSGSGYPGDAQGTAPTVYSLPNETTQRDIRVSNVNKAANVMRFVSPTAFHSKTDVDTLTSGTNMASCLTSWAYMDESAKEQSVVLGGLRDFRDNVLKGTAIGDWIIDSYYNDWSPFVVNNLEFMKPVIKTVLKPISVICGLFANI